jgi:hypothetical protein
MHAYCKAPSSFLLTILLLTGCTSSSSRHSVQIAGGQAVELERQGSGFKQAENARVIVANASLEAVNLNGINYVRWKFAISPKQATSLSLIRIEEVSGPTPLLLINDVAPQTDGGRWSESGGLMDLSSASARWLFEPGDTVRVFRFTFNEPDGQSYLLYQAVPYTPASKQAIRTMVRE